MIKRSRQKFKYLRNETKREMKRVGRSGTGLNFSITIDLQIFKTFFVDSFKKYVKTSVLDLNKRGLFLEILSYIQRAAILVLQGLTS